MEHDTEPDAGESGAAVEPTGEPRVDAAVRSLGELDGLPVAEHPGVFEQIHGRLVDVLGELHSGGDPASPADPAGKPRGTG